MPTWKAYLQLNGEDEAKYITITSEIPDELYAKIQAAIEAKTPLFCCPFYSELCSILRDSFSLEDYLEIDDEEPQREDYDDDEDGEDEYQEALNEYKETVESVLNDYEEVRFDVFDPTDELLFKEKFIGKKYLDYDGENVNFCFESEGESCIRYDITVVFDKDGNIENIDISAEGLEAEGVTSSSWGDAYPDYDFLEEYLRDALSIYEDDDEE